MTPITKYRTCHLCEAMCGIAVDIEDNKPTKIYGDKEDPFSKGHICPKAFAIMDIHNDPDRLTSPLKKVNGVWEKVSWQSAFDEIALRVLSIQEAHGIDAVAMYNGNPTVHNLGSTLFVPQFLRVLKTKNKFSATSVDQLAHHLASQHMFGNGNILPVPDIDRTDFWLILGGNPMVSNGSIMTAPDISKKLRNITKRGGKVVVVDPKFTRTAERASQHLFIKPGTDIWLLLAMINYITQNDHVNLGHLSDMIGKSEADNIKKAVEFCTPKLASSFTGIDEASIIKLTKDFLAAESAVCYGRLGVSTVQYGSLSQWAVNVINILTGNFDNEGGAMFPLPAFDSVRGKTMTPKFGRWRSRVRNLPEYGGELPAVTMAEEILTEGKGQIKALFTNCGNPVLSTPNGRKLDKALDSLEFMVSMDIYLNETTRHADFILPPATGLEVPHFDIAFNNLAIRNTVKYSDPLIHKASEALYDYQIFQGLMKALQKDKFLDDDNQRRKLEATYQITPEIIVDQMLRTSPYDLTVSKLRENPHGIDLGPLTQCIQKRIITPDGKIDLFPKIYIDEIEKVKAEDSHSFSQLVLIGRRHLRSNNSWMHNSPSLMKGPGRCTAQIHPTDASTANIKNGENIKIKSRVGEVSLPAEITNNIAQGVVSIPHGWGHNREGSQLSVAGKKPGASINDLTDELFIEELTGVAILSGIPITLYKEE